MTLWWNIRLINADSMVIRTEDFLNKDGLDPGLLASCEPSHSVNIRPVPLPLLRVVIRCEIVADLGSAKHAKDLHLALFVGQKPLSILRELFCYETTINEYSCPVRADEGNDNMITVGAISHSRTEKHDMCGVPAALQYDFSKGEIW